MALFSATAVNAQKKNVIKIRPTVLPLQMYDVMYERGITAKTSAAIEFSIFNYDVTKIATEQLKPNGTINDADLGGYMITPQFRYYFKGESPKGFYVNPFLQYGQYSISQTNTDTFNIRSSSSASINIKGLGLGLGYQWLLGMFTIDWNFFGVAVQTLGAEFHYELNNPDNMSNAVDIQTNLNNTAFFEGFEVTTKGAGIEVKAPSVGILPMLKTNLSIGVCF
ncbi:MAG: DUF3575 domain-containing protein [Flavobacteriales bacterium]